MNEEITQALDKIEQEHEVKILWAAEAGSRAWGFESPDSDYDVRFVYMHPARQYLRVTKWRDVIEQPGPVLDVSGWDLRKALGLMGKSNPSLIEWIESPIVYHQGPFGPGLAKLTRQFYRRRSAMYHYLHMAKGNNREFLQRDFIRMKKYLYVIRPLLACRWIYLKGTIPPVRMEEMRELCPVWEAVEMLVEEKRIAGETAMGPRIPVISDWILAELEWVEKEVKDLPDDKGDPTLLDDFLWRATRGT